MEFTQTIDQFKQLEELTKLVNNYWNKFQEQEQIYFDMKLSYESDNDEQTEFLIKAEEKLKKLKEIYHLSVQRMKNLHSHLKLTSITKTTHEMDENINNILNDKVGHENNNLITNTDRYEESSKAKTVENINNIPILESELPKWGTKDNEYLDIRNYSPIRICNY